LDEDFLKTLERLAETSSQLFANQQENTLLVSESSSSTTAAAAANENASKSRPYPQRGPQSPFFQIFSNFFAKFFILFSRLVLPADYENRI
jgi:hypothetical protein